MLALDRILLALDIGPECADAADEAAFMARTFGATISVATVQPADEDGAVLGLGRRGPERVGTDCVGTDSTSAAVDALAGDRERDSHHPRPARHAVSV